MSSSPKHTHGHNNSHDVPDRNNSSTPPPAYTQYAPARHQTTQLPPSPFSYLLNQNQQHQERPRPPPSSSIYPPGPFPYLQNQPRSPFSICPPLPKQTEKPPPTPQPQPPALSVTRATQLQQAISPLQTIDKLKQKAKKWGSTKKDQEEEEYLQLFNLRAQYSMNRRIRLNELDRVQRSS